MLLNTCTDLIALVTSKICALESIIRKVTQESFARLPVCMCITNHLRRDQFLTPAICRRWVRNIMRLLSDESRTCNAKLCNCMNWYTVRCRTQMGSPQIQVGHPFVGS